MQLDSGMQSLARPIGLQGEAAELVAAEWCSRMVVPHLAT